MGGFAKPTFPVVVCQECCQTAVSASVECPYCGSKRLRHTTRLSLRACRLSLLVLPPSVSVDSQLPILDLKRDSFWRRIWRLVEEFFQEFGSYLRAVVRKGSGSGG